jgi:hypothetical protein
MSYYFIAALAVLAALALFELRVRKPDQLALFEKNHAIALRRGRLYPRHFTLIIASSVHSYPLEILAEARGKLKLMIKMSVSVAADPDGLNGLIRAGGWNSNAVAKAAIEINTRLNSLVQNHCFKLEIDDISPEALLADVEKDLVEVAAKAGLKVVNISVSSLEPEDTAISEAIMQRESARILERTEEVNQHTRIAVNKAKIVADETIAQQTHMLELKKLELRKVQENQEALLAQKRVEDELTAKRMRMEIEKEELKLLSAHPELLILSPQITKLADATRNLKNARTVVSLSGKELAQEKGLGDILSETIGRFAEKLNSEVDND